jgi:hypothetical protein
MLSIREGAFLQGKAENGAICRLAIDDNAALSKEKRRES